MQYALTALVAFPNSRRRKVIGETARKPAFEVRHSSPRDLVTRQRNSLKLGPNRAAWLRSGNKPIKMCLRFRFDLSPIIVALWPSPDHSEIERV